MKKFLKKDKLFNFIIFPLIITLLMDIFYKANGIVLTSFTNYAYLDCFVSIFKYPLPFLVTFLTIGSLNALLISVTNSKISKIILTAIMLVLMVVNDFKFVIMELPIRISDISYLNASNGGMMVSFFDSVKGTWIFKTIFKTIGCLIILVFIIKNDKKIHTKIKKIKNKIIIILISLILLILPWFPNEKAQEFYLETLYPNQKDKETLNDSDIIKTYYKYGFLPGIYYFHLKDNVTIVDEYSKENAKKALDKISDNTNNSWEKPNVVIILSESLSDANNLEDIEFDTDLLSNIRSYEQNDNTEYFNLLVPTYGGASVNSEFEILTGANLSFFSPGYIPYNQLYNNQNSPFIPNIIKEFNDNDYTTKYITAWGPDSYRSSYIYDKFEVDEKIYSKDLVDPIKKGPYIADSYMMDVILEELKNKENEERKFLFVPTGQNHMPCSKNRYDEYDIEVVNTNYSEEDTSLLKCYAQGVYDADKELKRLYEEVLKLDDQTIIVLYGDHLPYVVNSDGDNIYLKDSYFNTDDENINVMRKYTTPAVILSNYGIEIDDLDFINANYLGSYILNNLDLEISDYFKYVNYNMNIFPVYNRSFIYIDNKFKTVDELSYKEQKQFHNIEQVQYYKFFDYDEENIK